MPRTHRMQGLLREGVAHPRHAVLALALLVLLVAGLVLAMTGEGFVRPLGLGIVVAASLGEVAYWLRAVAGRQWPQQEPPRRR